MGDAVTSRLVVDSDRDGYIIGWYFPAEGELGALLGDEDVTAEQVAAAKDPEHWETLTAHYVAGQTKGVSRPGFHYVWPTRAAANSALKAVKQALKAKGGKPWPAWALEAKAAGWTPPKGWTP